MDIPTKVCTKTYCAKKMQWQRLPLYKDRKKGPRFNVHFHFLTVRIKLHIDDLLTCATLLISALPMPFPERQIQFITWEFTAHTNMPFLWNGLFSPGHLHNWYLLHSNNAVSVFEAVYATSELRHHVQVLHENGSARPWAVGIEVKCIAYLRMAWKQTIKNVKSTFVSYHVLITITTILLTITITDVGVMQHLGKGWGQYIH